MRKENGYICSGRAGRRGRIGLPYLNNEFLWDDETRAPETIPKELMLQQKDLDKVKSTSLGMLLSPTNRS